MTDGRLDDKILLGFPRYVNAETYQDANIRYELTPEQKSKAKAYFRNKNLNKNFQSRRAVGNNYITTPCRVSRRASC